MGENIIMDIIHFIDGIYTNTKRGSTMLRILLADDEPLFLAAIEKRLTKYAEHMQINVRINKYERDDMSSIVLSTYDIAFLDIDFGKESGSGIEIARRIREKRNDTIIIFVTNFIEYAPEGYELKAFRYLLKTDIDTKLETYFKQAITHFTSKREMITVQNNGELINIPIDDILYLESDKHTVHFNMYAGKRKRYSCYSTLQHFAQSLEHLGFLRTHKSYLVNMNYITKLQCSELTLRNGATLSVSEKNYAEIKKKYLLWKGVQTWNT